MASSIDPGVVSLNSVYYPVLGRVHKRLINQSPVRSWNMRDFTKGMGKLERKTARDDKYLWWSECDTDRAGHIVSPPPATASTLPTLPSITDGGMEAWDDANTLTSWTKTVGTGGSLAQGTGANKYAGTYSADLYAIQDTGSSTTTLIYQDAANWSNNFRSKQVTVTAYVKTALLAGSSASMTIGDGTDTTTVVLSGSSFTQYTGTHVINAAGTRIRVTFNAISGTSNNCHVYVDSVAIATPGTTSKFCNHGSDTYLAMGEILYKLSSSTGAYLLEGIFPASITDLVSTVDSSLAVLLGDDDALWYIASDSTFNETDETGATYGIHWNGSLYWINSDGSQISFAAALATTLVETDDGDIPSKVTVQGLDTYNDAAGSTIIYARTTSGVWAHDSTNDTFYKIDVQLPVHTNTAKAGLVADGYYISNGLQLIRYNAGGYDALADTKAGLDALDGVPSEMNAHIVALIRGIGFTYALMDSTAIGATGYSWVGKRNDITGAWSCIWKTGTVNQAMHAGIVSDVYARRLWFDCGGTIYYIPLSTTNLFPKLVSGSTYTTGALFITPWFEGDGSTIAKTFSEFLTYAKDVTATETITIAYRTDRTNTDIATGWTTLVALDTTGEAGRVATTLASGAGIAFNAIQFRVVFACSPSTDSADLQNMELKYIDNVTPKWAYTFRVDLSKEFNGQSPEEMEADLETAAESTTLLAFNYRDRAAVADTYVKVAPIAGRMPTGEDYKGYYELTLFEP